MIQYQTIYEMLKSQRRLKKGYRWRSDSHTSESDQLVTFTLGPQAQRDSESNLQELLSVARDYDMSTVILRDHKIQIAGAGTGRALAVVDRVFSRDWLRGFNEWMDTTKWSVGAIQEDSGRGEWGGFRTYRHCFCLPAQQGVYDVATGRRLTNRQEIIERYWDLGFAAWRGRPATIAELRWSGTRSELEELSELADRYWHRGIHRDTEVSRRIVSSFRSINRYAAWPGAW